jgi:hypothetical protein
MWWKVVAPAGVEAATEDLGGIVSNPASCPIRAQRTCFAEDTILASSRSCPSCRVGHEDESWTPSSMTSLGRCLRSPSTVPREFGKTT